MIFEIGVPFALGSQNAVDMVMSSDGKYIYIITDGNPNLFRFNTLTMQIDKAVSLYDSQGNILQFSAIFKTPDNSQLWLIYEKAYIVDTYFMAVIGNYEPKEVIVSISFSPDSKIAWILEEGYIEAAYTTFFMPIGYLKLTNYVPLASANQIGVISNNGQYLYYTCTDTNSSTDTNDYLITIALNTDIDTSDIQEIYNFIFSSSTNENQTIATFQSATIMTQTFAGLASKNSMVISPNGKLMVISYAATTAPGTNTIIYLTQIIDTETLEIIENLNIMSSAIAFTYDNNYLWIIGNYNTIPTIFSINLSNFQITNYSINSTSFCSNSIAFSLFYNILWILCEEQNILYPLYYGYGVTLNYTTYKAKVNAPYEYSALTNYLNCTPVQELLSETGVDQ